MNKRKNNYVLPAVETLQVIRVSYSQGSGTKDDPCRIVTSYWDMDGDLITVDDPIEDKDHE